MLSDHTCIARFKKFLFQTEHCILDQKNIVIVPESLYNRSINYVQ